MYVILIDNFLESNESPSPKMRPSSQGAAGGDFVTVIEVNGVKNIEKSKNDEDSSSVTPDPVIAKKKIPPRFVG